MGQISRLPGLISEYFIIESLISSSRTSDVYKALDKFKRQSVALWRSRSPLAVTSGQVDAFIARISQMSRVSPSTEILSFGVDAGGFAFAVFPALDGILIANGNPEKTELERRFLAVLRIMEKFHSAGVASEDFTIDSFFVDRNGVIKFLNILGGFDSAVQGTSDLPPVNSLRYLPPEHRLNGGGSIAGDVFSIGVLGFKLLTGAFPDLGQDETYDHTRPPSAHSEKVSGWADEVLLKCIASDPSARYDTAGSVLAAINSWRESEAQRELTPALIDDSGSNKKSTRVGSEAVPIALGHKMGEEKRIALPDAPVKPDKKVLGPIGIISFVGLVALTAWIVWGGLLNPSSPATNARIDVAPGDIDVESGDSDAGVGAKTKYVTKLTSSDDPLAHDALIRELREAQSKEFSEFVWKAILDRSRRVGVQRASDQLRAWGKSQGEDFKPLSVEGLLRCLDIAYPDSERQAVLRQLYPTFPKLLMRFTAALALDFARPNDFRDILAMMVQETEQVTDAAKHSGLTLMMLLPDVSSLFLDDIASSIAQISDDDLKWVLAELAKRGNSQMPRVADIALSRKLIVPPFTSFLEVLRRKTVIPQPVMAALVNGALSKLSASDGKVLSNWLDQDSFPALAAAILTTSDPNIKSSAVEAMLTKPTSNRLLQRLIDFGKANYKDEIGKLAEIISALALEDRLGNIDLDQRLKGIELLPRSRDVLGILMTSESSRVITTVARIYKDAVSTAAYLDLLGNRDKAVRILAIEHLSESNDIVALKIIIDSYEEETDGDVKAAYEKFITVIKERKK